MGDQGRAGRAGRGAERERPEQPVEPERRPTYKTLDEQALAAVPGLVVTWWITEAIPIPITGVVGSCPCAIPKVASADDVFGSVADSTILLFIGSFIIAEAMLVLGRQLDLPDHHRLARTGPSGSASGRLMLVITYGITVGACCRPSAARPT